jgi:hypothetical protein
MPASRMTTDSSVSVTAARPISQAMKPAPVIVRVVPARTARITTSHAAAPMAASREAHRPSSGYSCTGATVPHSGHRTIKRP